MNGKRALISGVSGQDGSLLAKFLFSKGYEVHGTSRDAELSRFDNLRRLGIGDRVVCRSMDLTDFRSVLQVLTEVEPHEVYNLAGQTSVGLSFEQPVETLESIAHSSLILLEVLRYLKRPIRLYNAGSSECFGEAPWHNPATETSPFRPRSPYGVAKSAAFWQTANYREAYGLFACSGLLFNHESSFRPARFVTRKVVETACRIASGEPLRLKIGATHIVRDWGWAEDYVDAMWRMLQQDQARDFVVATGVSHRLEDFISLVFATLDLDWRRYTDVDQALYRTTDISESYADPSLARDMLGWEATLTLPDVVERLVNNEKSRMAATENQESVRSETE